jgi:hypothetical protein
MGKFPIKKEGDALGAEHVNWLTEGVERLGGPPSGGYLVGRSGLPPFGLQNFEVVEEGCDGYADLYRIVPRYWNNAVTPPAWASEDSSGDKGFSLDATDTGQTYVVGDKVQAYYDAQRGAYIPLAASITNSTTGGGSCPCTCIEDGDIEVQGIITTSEWSVTMPEVRFSQVNGTIIFPAGSYTLTYSSISETWTLDIGDDLTAEYNSGGDATADTTMDGTLVMSWSGGVAEINLCVDGTVPVDPDPDSSSVTS